MTDLFSAAKRSEIMSRVRARDTRPEKVVRSTIHRMGYRFRLHVRTLPGCPDIVLPRLRKVIFVHGCFWHGHAGCRRGKPPASNVDFWNTKIQLNIKRDLSAQAELRASGWDVLVVWECELRDSTLLTEKLRSFLAGGV